MNKINLLWGTIGLLLALTWIYTIVVKTSWYKRKMVILRETLKYKNEIRIANNTKRRFRRARKIAIKKSLARNKRYYVVEGKAGHFVVFNANDFERLKKNGTFRSNLDINDLLKVCSFITQ